MRCVAQLHSAHLLRTRADGKPSWSPAKQGPPGCGRFHAQDGVKGSIAVRSQVASLQNHTSRSSASTAGLLGAQK